jgi:hypothetical protein
VTPQTVPEDGGVIVHSRRIVTDSRLAVWGGRRILCAAVKG